MAETAGTSSRYADAEKIELLRISHNSDGSEVELPGSGWGGNQTGKDQIFQDVQILDEETCGSKFKSQLLSFCGIGDDDDDQAEDWAKWSSRKRMMDKRVRSNQYRQPQPVAMRGGMMPQAANIPPYTGDEIDGQGRKKARLYSRDKIYTHRPGRRLLRPGPISQSDVEPFYKVMYKTLKDKFGEPKVSEKKNRVKSRSFAPSDLCEYGREGRTDTMQHDSADSSRQYSRRDPNVLNDVFFDRDEKYTPRGEYAADGSGDVFLDGRRGMTPTAISSDSPPDYDEVDNVAYRWETPQHGGWEWREPDRSRRPAYRGAPYGMAPQAEYEMDSPYSSNPFQQMGRLSKEVKDNLMATINNSDRWDATKSTFLSLMSDGVFAKCFGFKYDRYYKYAYDSTTGTVKADRSNDHRSGFTAWLTFVQIIICIVSVSVYGFAPYGIAQTEISMEILTPTLTLEKLSYKEPSSFWAGPRQADLIHLGAKYSPCMRLDSNVDIALMYDKQKENATACCIYNDGSGCVQSPSGKCPTYLATFQKWTKDEPGPEERISGSVCGQDPKYCKSPASLGAYTWRDDITEWPVCTESVQATHTDENRHLNCEIRGRPCCYGIQGECKITTREHCEFLRGFFHEEAFLCSQVPCVNEICGMLPFGNPEVPDQFYRLFTCIFLHAGLIHLVVTIVYNLFILRPVEIMIGWIRVIVIFFGSGIAGSLASAIFLPYLVTAGPAGAHLGIIACHMVLIILFVEDKKLPLIKVGCFVLALLLFGLLPMVDNYAHIFGFIFGFLVSFAILPFAKAGKSVASTAKMRRYIAIAVCSLIAIAIAALLIILFYVAPIYNCSWCHYFTCIPFTADFCLNQEVKMRQVVSY